MNNAQINIAAAILAGGKNTRINSINKAFLRLGNVSLIEKSIYQLKHIYNEIMIITNSVKEYEPYKKICCIVEDNIKDIGPLCGIYTVLCSTTKEAVFFTACDMPNLHIGFVYKLITFYKQSQCEAVVPKINHFIEPLFAVYKTTLKKQLLSYIQNNQNLAVRGFLNTIQVSYMNLKNIHFNKNIFTNINTLKDWEKYKKAYEG